MIELNVSAFGGESKVNCAEALNKYAPLNPDFAFGCTHKCFMHLKVALSIALIVTMELFLNRSVQNLHLAAFRSDRICI